MHVNDVFSFLKNYFWHQHIKTIQNILNFYKKKFWIFWKHDLHRVPKQFHVIKWVEAEIFAEITIYKVVSILLKNIIYKAFFLPSFFFFSILDLRK
jgi:hypothetical protein